MINKIENPQSSDESRMIFDYSHVIELLFDAHLKLSSKVYDHLFDSRYKCLFLIDFKHVYFIISLHLNDQHYLFLLYSILIKYNLFVCNKVFNL